MTPPDPSERGGAITAGLVHIARVSFPGFSQPAEWTHHDAVWTAWPHDPEQWTNGLDLPRAQLAAMSAAIVDVGLDGRARGEQVELLVRNSDDQAQAMRALGRAAVGVRFHQMPYGDTWLRDTGPIFVTRPGEVAAAFFRFDGWGGKYLMPDDTKVATRVSRIAGTFAAGFEFVLEGGAVEVDGTGTLLTTRQCLLGGGRNPGLDQVALDARLRWALGAEQIVWLDQGLANDHTDGHIDTLARFVAPGVVACMEPAADDPNRDALRAILDDLRAATDARGQRLEVVTVPSPGAVVDPTLGLLPASYMNFYIANTVVVVPTYGVAADDRAVARIAAMFPGRRTIGLPCKEVVVGGGGFHCCTQQQPSAPALLTSV